MIQAKQLHVKGSGLRLNCDSAPRSTSSLGLNWWKLGLLVLGIYLVWVLVWGIWDIRLAYRRIDEARRILALEQTKAEKLKEKWEEVQTRKYLEKVARDDLNMQKEGETIVIMPKTRKTLTKPDLASQDETEKTQKQEVTEEPNWRKWWKLVR